MKSIHYFITSIIALSLFVTTAQAQTIVEPTQTSSESYSFGSPSGNDFVEDYIKGHLRLGKRFSEITLDDDNRDPDDAYLGTINQLDAEQDYVFSGLFLQYLINPYFGFEYAYERFEMTTGTIEGDSDGAFILRNSIFQVVGRYPNDSVFTPFVALGFVYMSSNFDHNDAWHNGFRGDDRDADHQAWVDMGSPPYPNGGIKKSIDPENGTGYSWMIGCEAKIDDNWSAELSYRYVELDVDANYSISQFGNVIDDRGSYTFPATHYSISLGISYSFH